MRVQEKLIKTKNEIILVVDGKRENIGLIERILFEEGYNKVLFSSSGSEALSMVNEIKPDLVLLNINIPDMIGYDVCSELKKNKETSDIPIIVLTAEISQDKLDKVFEVGVFDLIKEPFDEIDLIARVRAALRLKQSKDEVKLASKIAIEEELRKQRDYLDKLVGEQTSELKNINEELQRKISDHKRVIEALKSEQNKNKNIVENIGEGLFVLNTRGIITYVNPEVKRIIGYTKEEIIGRGLRTIIPKDALKLIIFKILKCEAIQNIELELIKKNGTPIFVEATIAPNLENGKIIGFLGVIRDITERKQAEEMLKKTLEVLEQSNKELEQFAFIASHDLQEPLRMIGSFTQLLSKRYKGKLDSEADEYIDYAVDGAKRLQERINCLLEYSRIGTKGKLLKPTDCEAVLDEVLDRLTIEIEKNSAVITHDPMPTVNADDMQIVLVLQNLIKNAIMYRSDEKLQIHISAEKKDDEWVFSVRDNGIGIDMKYKDYIFLIFRFLDKGRKGTGTGLAISKKIVERHGGRIWVESELEKGSTFYFTIPVEGG